MPDTRKTLQNFNTKPRKVREDQDLVNIETVKPSINTNGASLDSNYPVPANPYEDDDDLDEQGITLTERELKDGLTKREAKIEQREREARDHRSQLLEAVKVSAPEINKRLLDTFEKLSLEDHKFAEKHLTRIFQNDAQLQNTIDFFDLNLAQREDLLDRIGFYKGIIIDHSMSNPVETGFKEVLRREVDVEREGKIKPTSVAALLYRKPNFTGYFENHFASTEAMHQVQKNGVTDIKSSLTVAAGKAASVGVGVSAAYYDAEGSNGGGIKKKIYITANFFLPKVELSFDTTSPCASQEFEDACLLALAEENEESKFKAIVKVLGCFGQFVATQTLVGGRLFATDVKTFDGSESESEAVNRYAGRLKVAGDTGTASFESDTSFEKSKQENSRNKDTAEKQSFTIHAVGGEGAVIEQAGKWAESLYDYQRWSAVQRERLIPSINVLTPGTRTSIANVLKEFATKHSAMDLVTKYRAYFLFYGKYDDEIGRHTRHDIVVFKNSNDKKCLAVHGESPQAGSVTGKEFEWTRQALWRVTPNGNIVSVIPVAYGFPGNRKTTEFALTALIQTPKEGETAPTTVKVGLAELAEIDRSQVWELTGTGELRNAGLGPKYSLSLPLNGTPVLKQRNDTSDSTIIWNVQEATADDITRSEIQQAYFVLKAPNGLVLSIEGCEDTDSRFTTADRRRIALQRDIGSRHQLWTQKSDGTLVSAITIVRDSTGDTAEVCLSTGTGGVAIAQANIGQVSAFKLDPENRLKFEGAENVTYLVAVLKERQSAQRVITSNEVGDALTLQRIASNASPIAYSVGVPKTNFKEFERIATVDKRELRVDGHLTGIKFIVEERGKGRASYNEYYRLRMMLSVERKDGTSSSDVELSDEPDEKDNDRDHLDWSEGGYVFVDNRYLFLPDEPIYSIRLITSTDGDQRRRLAFEYRLTSNGDWYGLSSCSEKMELLKQDRLGAYQEFDDLQKNGNKITAIALDYDPYSQRIRPKFLRRMIG